MDPEAFQVNAFQNDAFQVGVAIAIVVARHGKYKPEHDGALVDLGNARGFDTEHGSALKDLGDAGI